MAEFFVFDRSVRSGLAWLIGAALLAALLSRSDRLDAAEPVQVVQKQPPSTTRKAAPQRRSRIRAQQPRTELPTAKPPATWDQATLDAFFLDARQHLGPGGPRAITAAASAHVVESKTPAAVTTPTNLATWSKLISRDTLETEVKQLLADINVDVQSPGSFKSGGFRTARLHFTLLAALFNVIAQYDSDVRWKQNAAAWADLFGRAGRNCKAGSDASYKEAKLRAGDLAEMVRGSDVEPSGATDGNAPWAERVDRRPLMSRLELSQQERFSTWTASEAEFRRHQAELQHEAELLATIAEIIQREGYEFADDENFRALATEFQSQTNALRKAAVEGDYSQARSAASQVNQSCEKCHADFRS